MTVGQLKSELNRFPNHLKVVILNKDNDKETNIIYATDGWDQLKVYIVQEKQETRLT